MQQEVKALMVSLCRPTKYLQLRHQLTAEPVIKPATAGAGMNSVIHLEGKRSQLEYSSREASWSATHPSRSSPKPRVMTPHMNASALAITSGLHSVDLPMTLVMTLCVWRDMTATGPTDTSFEVAKMG